jgi:hypothetical protein
MAMLYVNGVALRDPSELQWSLQDVSAADAGRTEDGLMQKNRVAQKRKLVCKWNGLRPEEASPILQAVNPEYMDVTYFDAMDGEMQTRTMYVGDRTAPVKLWTGAYGKIYASIAFDFIER